MSNRLITALSTPLLCAIALGQQATITVQALTPVTAVVGDGSQTWPESLPAGALPNNGQVGGNQAPQGAPRNVTVGWGANVGAEGALFTISMFATGGPVGSFGNMGAGEFLVTVAGTGGAALPWRLEGGLGSPLANISGLLFSIDFGNDGTIDWTPNSAGPFSAGSFGADLNTQPLVMRVTYQAAHSGQAPAWASLALRVVPGDVDAFRMPTNCYSFATYSVVPLMSPGADLLMDSGFSGPSWQFIGFSASPTLLPISLTATPLPCQFVPSLDWSHMTPTAYIQIPAAVRPISFFTQSVGLVGGNVRVSDTFLVTAN